jgi:hypothetical protein
MPNTHIKEIVENLELLEDLDKVIKVREALLNSDTLEEWLETMDDLGHKKYMYYLHEFARAHREVYGD